MEADEGRQSSLLLLSRQVKALLSNPIVVNCISAVCVVGVIPFAIVAEFWRRRDNELMMWCNIFWAVLLPLAAVAVQRFGVQRVLALILLLVALMYLGAAGVFLQLNNPILAAVNAFWSIVFFGAAFVLNPRREQPEQPTHTSARDR